MQIGKGKNDNLMCICNLIVHVIILWILFLMLSYLQACQ